MVLEIEKKVHREVQKWTIAIYLVKIFEFMKNDKESTCHNNRDMRAQLDTQTLEFEEHSNSEKSTFCLIASKILIAIISV